MSDSHHELDLGLECERRGDTAAAAEHYFAAAALAPDDPEFASEALRRAAVMRHLQSDFDGALETATRAASVAEAAGLRDPYGAALNAAGIVHQARGDFVAARKTFEQVLAIAAGDKVRGVALQNLGAIAAQTGAWDLAKRRFEQSRACFQRAQHTLGEAIAVGNYGRAALDHGNYELAAQVLQDAMAVAARLGDANTVALATMNYAEAVFMLGDHATAERHAAAALETFTATGNAWRRIEALRLLGDLAQSEGDIVTAGRHWTEGLKLAEHLGTTVEAQKLRVRIAEAH